MPSLNPRAVAEEGGEAFDAIGVGGGAAAFRGRVCLTKNGI